MNVLDATVRDNGTVVVGTYEARMVWCTEPFQIDVNPVLLCRHKATAVAKSFSCIPPHVMQNHVKPFLNLPRMKPLDFGTLCVSVLSISPQCKWLVAAGRSAKLAVFDVVSWQALWCNASGGEALCSVAWSADSKYVASGSVHGKIRVCDAHNHGQVLWTISTGQPLAISSLALSHDGQYLTAAGEAQELLLCNVSESRQIVIQSKQGIERRFMSVAWRSDGKCFAAGGYSGEIVVCDLDSRVRFDRLHNTDGEGVSQIAWSCNGAYFAAGGSSGLLVVYAVDFQPNFAMYSMHEVRRVDCNDGLGIARIAWDGPQHVLCIAGDVVRRRITLAVLNQP